MGGRLYAVFSLAARIVSHTLRRIKAPAAFPSLRGEVARLSLSSSSSSRGVGKPVARESAATACRFF
jgi:hypothetical protein